MVRVSTSEAAEMAKLLENTFRMINIGLAPSMDGVILVVKPGTTKLSAFQQALEQLRGVGARVLGVGINEVNPLSRK